MKELYWQRARLVFGAEMSPACKLVLLALSDHLGSNASCYPSVPRLQLRTGYSRMSVLRALAELEQLGAIQITRAPGRSNVYTLDLDWLRVNQYHPGTSTTEVPVPQRDGYQYHPGTTPVECLFQTPPVVDGGAPGRAGRRLQGPLQGPLQTPPVVDGGAPGRVDRPACSRARGGVRLF